MTHRSIPDPVAIINAAREAREAREAERETALITEQERGAGEVSLESIDLLQNADLDHETKMARFEAARAVLRGETPVVVSVPASPAASESMIDLESIDPQARSVIERVLKEPHRYFIEIFDALKDKEYARLKREYDRNQQRTAETEVAEGDEPPSGTADRAAQAPKAEAPAKKAPKKEPETEVTTPVAQPKKLSFLERGKRAWKNG